MFKKETDPTKLGKSLSESINKKTIIGTLLILMVLPLLNRDEIDFSINFFLMEVFWFGISGCQDPNGFFCTAKGKELITEEGWYEVLRGAIRASEDQVFVRMKVILWIYVPDFTKKGTMNEIK